MTERRKWNDRGKRPPVPLVEIANDRRVLIENHQGVCGYTADQIRIRVRFGQISVTGSGLRIARMTRDQLVICGMIGEVSLIRDGGANGR